MTTVNDVADWFINRVDRESGDSITHLKLQKLLYFAQAWHLANRNKPLFKDDFQAWAHGPVVRAIYDRFRGQSWEPLAPVESQPNLSESEAALLEQVFETYGQYGAKYLENLTHKHQPWRSAREGLSPEERCETVITKKSMRDFYGKKIGKKWKN